MVIKNVAIFVSLLMIFGLINCSIHNDINIAA